MNYKSISHVVSFAMLTEGFLFMVCIPVAVYFGEPLRPFLLSSLFTIVPGIGLYSSTFKKVQHINQNREVFFTLILTLVTLVVLGTLPFLFSHLKSDPVDILFEITSGITTTGATVLPDLGILPKSLIFWRSLSQWMGGIGGLILVIEVLPAMNTGGYRFFSLRPSLRMNPFRLDRIILVILTFFGFLTLAETLLLWLSDANLFDSICFSLGTVSGGGFLPSNRSIGDYSIYFQLIILLFLVMSGISYFFYYKLISGKGWKEWKEWKNREVFNYVLLILGSTLILSLYSLSTPGGNPFVSVYRSFFSTVSAVSNTGYNPGMNQAPAGFPWLIITFLVIIGGCSGSPGGGIKISRLMVALKNIRFLFKPTENGQEPKIWLNRTPLTRDSNISILAFILIFGFIILAGSLALSFTGLSSEKSINSAITSLTLYNNGFCYNGFPAPAKIIMCILMCIGRLEILTVLAWAGSLLSELRHKYSRSEVFKFKTV